MNTILHASRSNSQRQAILATAGGALAVGNRSETTVVPVIDTNIYAAGDNVGGKLTLSDVIPVAGGAATLLSVTVTDNANQKPVMDLVVFNVDPSTSTLTNNTATTITAADLPNVIARIPIAASDWVTVGGKGIASLSVTRVLKAAASATTLYAALNLTSGTPTFTAITDLKVRLGFEQH